MAAVYHTQTAVSTPFFAGFTKSCGFPLARCTSGAAQKNSTPPPGKACGVLLLFFKEVYRGQAQFFRP